MWRTLYSKRNIWFPYWENPWDDGCRLCTGLACYGTIEVPRLIIFQATESIYIRKWALILPVITCGQVNEKRNSGWIYYFEFEAKSGTLFQVSNFGGRCLISLGFVFLLGNESLWRLNCMLNISQWIIYISINSFFLNRQGWPTLTFRTFNFFKPCRVSQKNGGETNSFKLDI